MLEFGFNVIKSVYFGEAPWRALYVIRNYLEALFYRFAFQNRFNAMFAQFSAPENINLSCDP